MEDDWLPPGFDAAKLTQAQRAFETALGADKVFFEPLDRTGYRDKFAIAGRRAPARGRDRADHGRGSPGGAADRQPVPPAGLADQPRQEPRLRRLGPAALGQRGDGPVAA